MNNVILCKRFTSNLFYLRSGIVPLNRQGTDNKPTQFLSIDYTCNRPNSKIIQLKSHKNVSSQPHSSKNSASTIEQPPWKTKIQINNPIIPFSTTFIFSTTVCVGRRTWTVIFDIKKFFLYIFLIEKKNFFFRALAKFLEMLIRKSAHNCIILYLMFDNTLWCFFLYEKQIINKIIMQQSLEYRKSMHKPVNYVWNKNLFQIWRQTSTT